ncbi:SigE family RNA polymerase sigma factor [Micromonospora rubida]|uniref:SigE family RNA polymerase sigma factor n=1 Tax=Micromonospora rubida TaxID=2697657 RepID=UPI001F48E102|nr:SigE family RNA polymerase sigma factor [Micromonospora rubida]
MTLAPNGARPGDFDEFYRTRFRGLTLQLYAYVGDLQEAQDLVQEAFCRAYVRWRKLRDYDDPARWVRQVAWNLAKSRFRRRRTAAAFLRSQRQVVVAGPDADRVALVRALATLSPQHRRAVVLHYMAQLSVAEIAAQEGVAEGTVKSWLSRGRAALANQLKGELS